jgi:hypothetical protein
LIFSILSYKKVPAALIQGYNGGFRFKLNCINFLIY